MVFDKRKRLWYDARMETITRQQKEKTISCRLYADEYDMFDEACRISGRSKSDVLRNFARNYVQEVGKSIVQKETGDNA